MNKGSGALILTSSMFAGFVFPKKARWILAGLVIMGLASWLVYEDKK